MRTSRRSCACCSRKSIAQIDWSRGYESLDKEFQQVVREAEVGTALRR